MMNAIIKDRVRYAFLLRYKTDNDPKPGTFQIISQSYLKDMLAAPSAAAGPAQAPVPGDSSGGSGNWEPLTSAGGTNPTTSAAAMGRFGPGRGMSDRAMTPRAIGGPTAGPVQVTQGPAPAASGPKKAYPRTEFVIIFFWQEPTPSDQLMNLTVKPVETPANQERR
jgi:hypothetical protein